VTASQTPAPALLLDKRAAENFPVALRVLPAEVRRDLEAVYGVVRVIDDLGDEAPGDRAALLAGFAADQHLAFTGGQPRYEVLRALVPTIGRRRLDEQPLRDLIEANLQDQRVSRYESYADLLGYCRLSAVPIGRLVLAIFDRPEPELARLSDDVCVALQILEHCQDVGEDCRRGRIYLPQQELRHYGVTPDHLTARAAGPELRALVATQVDRCELLLDAGDELVARLRGWARVAVAGYAAGGRATVAAFRRAGCDPLSAPVTPRRRDLAWHALRLLAGRGAAR